MSRWLLVLALSLAACKVLPPSPDAGVPAAESGRKLGSTGYTPAPTSLPPSGNCGGDQAGTYPNCANVLLNSASVPEAGALTTGNVLQVSGPSADTYAPITNSNLSPGTFSNVTGTGTLTAGATGSGFTVDLSASTLNHPLPLASLTGGTAAQVLVENSGATSPAWVSLSGGATVTAAGAVSILQMQGIAAKSGTPAIWSQWTYDSNATQWAGIGLVSATLTDASVTVDCALSSAGTLNASQFVLPAATSLTASRTVTVNTDSAAAGESITIVRLGLGAFTMPIVNGGTGGGTLATLPASKARQATLSFDGTNWFLVATNSVN
jgi:hypothetical protein